jgi:Acetyltransferase (GNAT) domain
MNRSDFIESIPDIQRLFRSAFHREVPESYLTWRLAANLDSQPIVTIHKQSGQIAAHYASTPLTVNVRGQHKRATLSVLGMTDPNFRGQGLFKTVFRAHETELRQQGFAFTYGFPNRNSDPIFLTDLGWLPIYEIPNYYLDLARPQRIRPSMGAVVFDDRFDRFDYNAFVERDGLICQPRNNDFLRWRYAHNPVNSYSNLVAADSDDLAAYGVCKTYAANGSRQLDLVDYFARDLPALESLMAAVCSYALDNDCLGINTWSPRHHFSHHYFNSIGFECQTPVTNMAFKSFDEGLTGCLRLFSNWWVTMGDSDVY